MRRQKSAVSKWLTFAANLCAQFELRCVIMVVPSTRRRSIFLLRIANWMLGAADLSCFFFSSLLHWRRFHFHGHGQHSAKLRVHLKALLICRPALADRRSLSFQLVGSHSGTQIRDCNSIKALKWIEEEMRANSEQQIANSKSISEARIAIRSAIATIARPQAAPHLQRVATEATPMASRADPSSESESE